MYRKLALLSLFIQGMIFSAQDVAEIELKVASVQHQANRPGRLAREQRRRNLISYGKCLITCSLIVSLGVFGGIMTFKPESPGVLCLEKNQEILKGSCFSMQANLCCLNPSERIFCPLNESIQVSEVVALVPEAHQDCACVMSINDTTCYKTSACKIPVSRQRLANQLKNWPNCP